MTLQPISAQALAAGTTLSVALPGSSTTTTDPISYTVSVSNSQLTNSSVSNPQLTTTVPTGNPSLKITVSDPTANISGSMVFQLADDLVPDAISKIESLISSGFYTDNTTTFYRVANEPSDNFIIVQGGADANASTTHWDDDFNQNLQFTSAGVLAMANSGSDTNGSEFFISGDATRYLDYRYTIFGFLTQGSSILQQIINLQSAGSDSAPSSTVTITGVSVITDNQDGVLRLSAPAGTTGKATINVTATDTVTGQTAEQSFQVNVAADTTVDPPYLQRPISTIQTTADTATTFDIPAVNVSGDAESFTAKLWHDSTNSATTNADVGVSVNSTTGAVTITPSGGVAGVYDVQVGVSAADPASGENTSADTQEVPLYIDPAAPTSIQLLPASDTGTSSSDDLTNLNNSSSSKTLQFEVSGVLSGADVQLFSDGTLIGEGAASGTTVTITTDGTFTLADGQHAITATQTLENQAVNVGNLDTTTDLASKDSAALDITVDTTAPKFTSTAVTAAQVGVPYGYQATATAASGVAVTYQLTQNPTGMTIDPTTGLISWTPTADETPTEAVNIVATDAAGNTAQQAFTIDVTAHTAPVLTAASPSLGTTDANVPFTVLLTRFINNGSGTTTISGSAGAVLGGIALTATTGAGTWDYSLNGTTFTAVGTIASDQALVLPKTASLRYVPAGSSAETATVTYRAWDTSDGATPGSLVTLSGTGAVGGTTAYSTDTDTASLAVSATVDSVVLTPAAPSLGETNLNTPKTVSLGSFINDGSGTTQITVPSSESVGIAITATTGSGTWKYSLDGTTFTAIGTVAADSALLLPATASLQYSPSGTAETATVTYLGWDGATGQAGNKADAATTGGTTAFSSLSDTASLAVANLNTAPVLTPAKPSLGTTDIHTAKTIALSGTFINHGTGTTTITDATSGAVIGGIAVTGTTGEGTWAYSLDGTTFTSIGAVAGDSALLLPSSASLRYTPDGADAEQATITYRAWDTTTGQAGTEVDAGTNGGTTAFSAATDTATLTVVASSLSGYVYLDAEGDGQRIDSKGNVAPGLSGVTVELYSQNSSGNWTEDLGVSPIQTAADGSYTFPDLGAGTYQIKVVPPAFLTAGTDNVGTIGGATQGTSPGANLLQVPLTTGESGSQYNFGFDGLQSSYISLRLFLASSPPIQHVIDGMIAKQEPAAPSGYTIASDHSTYNATTASSAGFSFASATVGDTYSYRVSSSGGGAAVTGYGTISSATQDVTGIDVSSLPDGTLTFSATLTNSAGAAGAAATATATLDQTAPSGYTIKADATTYDSTTATSAGFTFAGATAGDTYSYRVSSTGGGTAVTGSGTVSSATQNVTGINVSTLSSGTLNFSVTLTNAAGNVGAAATATASLS